MNKVAQLVSSVQPQAASAAGEVPPAPSSLQPAVAPISHSKPSGGAKPPVSASGMSLTSAGEMDKSGGIKRASILSLLYKHGAHVRKAGAAPDARRVFAKAGGNKRVLLKAAAMAVVTRRRALAKEAAANAPFLQNRGTDTLRLARWLGNRLNIDSLKNLSAGNLVSAGPDKGSRERQLLSRIGMGATGVAGLGAAGLGYGAYKAVGGGSEE